MCEHGTNRTLLLPTPDHTDPDGLRFKLRLWPVDACIADIVQALNAGGVTTLGACCGHGQGAGVIDLADGRVLVITSHAAAHNSRTLHSLPHAQPMSWDDRRAEYGQKLEVSGAMSNPTLAEQFPDWVPDIEAIGVIVYVATVETIPDPELIASARIVALGDGPDGWRRDLMLRKLWATASSATKKAIDALGAAIPRWVRDELTGAVVSL